MGHTMITYQEITTSYQMINIIPQKIYSEDGNFEQTRIFMKNIKTTHLAYKQMS